jgi:NTE family protein
MNQHPEPGSVPANALVLGGGGPVGASWEAALLHELGSAGFTVSERDLVVGTSAGSVVGAWLTMRPAGLTELPDRMRERAAWHAERAAEDRSGREALRLMAEKPGGGDSMLSVARSAATAAPPISIDEAERLWGPASPPGPWPPNLLLAAVNIQTGKAHAWSVDDDISVAVGIATSTAAPGVAPAVEVNGAVWVDGGVRSGTNADLIINAEEAKPAEERRRPGRALIVACVPSDDIAREESILTEHGYDVRVLLSEAYYRKPADLLDVRFVDAALEAGTHQGREAAADFVRWWAGR